MIKRLGIPLTAAIGLALAIVMLVIGMHRPPIPPIHSPPAVSPFKHFVAGSGIIEAGSLNINVGTAIDGLVEEVFVQPGDIVKEGAPLFRVDTRDLVAAEKEAEASMQVEVARLDLLMSQPRAEEIPPVEARVKQAKVRLSDEFTQYSLFKNVNDKRAISFNEFNQRKFAASIAKYELEQAQADLDLLQAGAWLEDIKVANRRLLSREATLNLAKTNLERATVRAPMDGQVMQVNINKGDVAKGSREDTIFSDALMIFGTIDPMHVRIDVDEDDAWRVYSGACACAFVRGNSEINFPLEFVRIEPFIIPKRSLTGENLERVDTRVLQLIYKFKRDTIPVYLGQLLDVFIEAKPSQGL